MPPKANLLFDVRFIDNPFWVEELRPLTGLHEKVKQFVLDQKASHDFFKAFADMVKVILPMHAASIAAKKGTPSAIDNTFVIAFGCTGGCHRSVAVAAEAAQVLAELFPQYTLETVHREIANKISLESKEKAL